MGPFFNTMSQNNTMSLKLHYFRWYSWTGSHRRIITQYNGSIPWWLPLVLHFMSTFFPYATCHIVSRVHTQLLIDISAYALRHTLFTIDLEHAEFLSSMSSELTVDTSELVHQTIFYQAQLHQVSCHHLHQVCCHSRTTLSIKHHFTSGLHHLPSPSGQ